MPDPTRGGAAIRARREALGLSLRECARRAGLSPTFLSRYECGQTTTGVPAGSALCRLARVLSLDEVAVCVAAGQAHPAALAAIRGSVVAARAAVAASGLLPVPLV